MASSKRPSPRQRMINLMYLVFIAMLALNISPEILDGFHLVNDNLQQNIANTVNQNRYVYSEIESAYKANPGKSEGSFYAATEVKTETDSLFNYIQDLKIRIAKKSDGDKADVNALDRADDLEGPSYVMLTQKEGEKLKAAIEKYKGNILNKISDPNKQAIINNALRTEPSEKAIKEDKNWQECYFEAIPSIAAITYLSELQSNIKQAEGEVLTNLLKNIDLKDFRVNELSAFVIPESRFVMRGSTYKANIVLAAVDTTQLPRIVINGKDLPAENKGLYQIGAGGTGVQTFKGYIEMTGRDGSTLQRPFTETYTVMEPMASISPELMDVLYVGIDNPMSISVPGVVNISARAEGGTLTGSTNKWIAKPARAGENMTIVVSAELAGTMQVVARKVFRSRSLPDPAAYIAYTDDKGTIKTIKRGLVNRSALLSAGGIRAAIDDGVLNVPFTVLRFQTFSIDAMGNASPEMSSGANFSDRQVEQIQRMARGKSLIISGIKVKGPDGSEREISPMIIQLN